MKITVPYHQVQLIPQRSLIVVVSARDQFAHFGSNQPIAEEEREAGDWWEFFLVVAAAPSLVFFDAIVCLGGADGWREGGGIKNVGVDLVANLSGKLEEVAFGWTLCLHLSGLL